MTFCIIPGGQRCGTSYLVNLLSRFSNVIVPFNVSQEPKWFLRENIDTATQENYLDEVYLNIPRNPLCIHLDKSTSYFMDEDAPSNILRILGDVPIIIILRSPVQRTWSHYKFSVKHGFEDLDFHQAIRMNPYSRVFDHSRVTTNPFLYIQGSMYFRYVSRWMQCFPNLKLLFFEEFVSNKECFLDLCEYLSLDRALGAELWDDKKINSSPDIPSFINEDDFRFLAALFSESNRLLQKLIGRPLPVSWNKSIL